MWESATLLVSLQVKRFALPGVKRPRRQFFPRSTEARLHLSQSAPGASLSSPNAAAIFSVGHTHLSGPCHQHPTPHPHHQWALLLMVLCASCWTPPPLQLVEVDWVGFFCACGIVVAGVGMFISQFVAQWHKEFIDF